MTDHVAEDLGAYILGSLPVDDERRVRLHLEACATCRDELARIQGAAELLDSARLSDEPPDELETEILRSVGRAPRRGPRQGVRRAGTVVVTVVLMAAAFGAGLTTGGRRRAEPVPDQIVMLSGAGGTGGSMEVYVLPNNSRRLELSATGLPELPPEARWEVWFSNGLDDRVAAGTFLAAPDGTAEGTFTIGASSADYTRIVITRSDASDGQVLVGQLSP